MRNKRNRPFLHKTTLLHSPIGVIGKHPSHPLSLVELLVLRYPHLKKQGRCTIHTPEAKEDGEGEVELTEEEAEEGPTLLTAIENDAKLEWSHPWTVISSSANPQIKHQVIGVRSNLWSGAFSAVKGTRFANVYVGWGLKEGPFNPQTPPPLSHEINIEELKESNALPHKPEKTQDETIEPEAE